MAVRICRTLNSQKYLASQISKKSLSFNLQQCSASSSASTTTSKVEAGSSYSSEKTTHFGFKTVTEEEKKNKGALSFWNGSHATFCSVP